MEYSKLEKLQKLGVVHSEGMTEAQKKQIETLSDEEIQALIDMKEKLDEFAWPLKTDTKSRMF